MTIASQTSRIGYTGDGVTTAFAVPFFFSANSDLVVSVQDLSGTVTTKLLGTDYNLTGAALPAGGTCTFVVAPTAGFLIAITRVPPLTQTTSYNNNDPFPAKSHENALDKLTTEVQYLKSLIDRTMLVAPTDNPPMTTLPPAAVRALKNLSFDGSGNPSVSLPATGANVSSVMAPVVAGSTLTIARTAMWDGSSVMSPVVLAASLAAARTALGVVGNAKLSKTVNYTVLNADKGSTIVLTGGSFTTLTFTGVYDNDFICTIINGESTPVGKGVTGTVEGDFTLYPKQGYLVYNDSGSGLRLLGGIRPYKVNSVALFCDATLGSDNVLIADGLAAGARAKKTQNASRQQLYQDFNHNGSQPTVTLTGTFNESITFAGQPVNCGVFFWNGASVGTYISRPTNSGSPFCWILGDGCCMETQNTKWDGNGINAIGVQMHQTSILDVLAGCEMGPMGTGTHFASDGSGWTLNINNSYAVSGGATSHFGMAGNGVINHAGGVTVTTTGAPTITTWFRGFGPILFSLGSSITWSGAPAAGCTKWAMVPPAHISLSGNAANVPGSLAGQPATGSAPTAVTGWATA